MSEITQRAGWGWGEWGLGFQPRLCEPEGKAESAACWGSGLESEIPCHRSEANYYRISCDGCCRWGMKGVTLTPPGAGDSLREGVDLVGMCI